MGEDGLGRRWTVFDVGMRARLRKAIDVGVRAWNAGGTDSGLLGKGGAIGVALQPVLTVWMVVEITKEASHPVGISVGGEYGWRDTLTIRLGAGGEPERTTMGIGVRRNRLEMDYAAIYHTLLGVTHRLSISFRK